jgi:hypothetical protein
MLALNYALAKLWSKDDVKIRYTGGRHYEVDPLALDIFAKLTTTVNLTSTHGGNVHMKQQRPPHKSRKAALH